MIFGKLDITTKYIDLFERICVKCCTIFYSIYIKLALKSPASRLKVSFFSCMNISTILGTPLSSGLNVMCTLFSCENIYMHIKIISSILAEEFPPALIIKNSRQYKKGDPLIWSSTVDICLLCFWQNVENGKKCVSNSE